MPGPRDLFATPHKGYRAGMFDVARAAGATDWTDEAASAVTLAAIEDIVRILEEHGEHEDEFVFPFLAAREPSLHAEIARQHEDHRRRLATIGGHVEAMCAVGVDHEKRLAAGMATYRALCRTVADELLHFDFEERVVLPALWALCTVDEIEGAFQGFLQAHGAEMRPFHAGVASAYTAAERAGMRLD